MADPNAPANWRTQGDANGTMGDLAPHMINGALALIGPIKSVIAEVETVHNNRPGGIVTNDDHGQLMCPNRDEAAVALVEATYVNGAPDNVTVVIADVIDAEEHAIELIGAAQ